MNSPPIENGAKRKTIPTNREMIVERERGRGSTREKERESLPIDEEAKRRKVCAYCVLFRREVESFFFFFEKVGS